MKRKCPECNSEMKIGRRKDEGAGFSVYQESWIAGSPKKNGPFAGIAWNDIPVVTYACMNCGRLISYLNIENEKNSNETNPTD
jgi:DNA-directed RNA polymerase subunit RPC12/RpoP